MATKLPATRLPPGFKTFDFFEQSSGRAISAKTLDTAAESYVRNPGNVYYTIRGYVNDAVNFTSSRVGPTIVKAEDITAKEIQLAIRSNATPAQLQQIAKGAEYATEQGVNLVVTEVETVGPEVPIP